MKDLKIEKSLKEALDYVCLPELPKPLRATTKLWLKALVRVSKRDGTEAYVYAKNAGDGTPQYIKDFGTTSQILGYSGIYPFEIVENSRIPDMRNRSETIDLLKAYGYNEAEIKMRINDKDIHGNPKTPEKLAEDKQFIQIAINKIVIEQESERLKYANEIM